MSDREDDTADVDSDGGNEAESQSRTGNTDTSTFKRPFGFLKKVPWEKMSIWALFLLLLWVLRDFFSIILFTFIFAYVANTIVRFGEQWVPYRRVLTVFVYLAFAVIIIFPGSWVGEQVIEQGKPIAKDAGAYIKGLVEGETVSSDDTEGEEKNEEDQEKKQNEGEGENGTKSDEGEEQKRDNNKRENDSGSSLPGAEEKVKEKKSDEKRREGKAEKKPVPEELRTELSEILDGDEEKQKQIENIIREQLDSDAKSKSGIKSTAIGEDVPDIVRNMTDKVLRRSLSAEQLQSFQRTDYYNRLLEELNKVWQQGIPFITNKANLVLQNTIRYAFHILVSLLFSFLIVFDIPNLKNRIDQLGEGKLSEFYEEIAPSLASFAIVMGRSLQAQALIAVVNTILTWFGLYILNIPNLALLTVIVFVCSFIPVMGVIISTIPIGIVALATGGVVKLVVVIALIILIHTIETYLLNPNIYGAHLKMHPLIVLIVLLVAEHFFGIWGLVLGVPVSVYLLEVVIQNRTPEELFSSKAVSET